MVLGVLTLLCINNIAQHHDYRNIFDRQREDAPHLTKGNPLVDDVTSLLFQMEKPQRRLYHIISQLDMEALELLKDRKVRWSYELASCYEYIQLRRAIYIGIKSGSFFLISSFSLFLQV